MIIDHLVLKDFRLYSNLDLSFHKYTNILFGDNGAGKTTILEAIHYLALTKSHKTQKDIQVIKYDSLFAKIYGVVSSLEKKKSLSLVLSKNGKNTEINGYEVSKLSEFIGEFNVVMFAPEDLELVKANPSVRRRFLDLELGQTSKTYLRLISEYRNYLKERNDFLKKYKPSELNKTLLETYTTELVKRIEQLMPLRSTFIHDINTYALDIYQKLSGKNDVLEVKYAPNIKGDIKSAFDEKEQYDLITKTTNVGIHRDEILFFINNKEVKSNCSQGEIRSVVLSVKLALVLYVNKVLGRYPVLLLDDVFSELDEKRQKSLLNFISGKIQTFITTTDIKGLQINQMNNYKLYYVNNSTVKEVTYE